MFVCRPQRLLLKDAVCYLCCLFLVLFCVLPIRLKCAHADPELIQFKTYVTDQAGILSAAELSHLENELRRLHEDKGSQVVLYTLPTTAPLTIEELAVKLFEVNKIGREGINDGVLLIVATQDRAVRIEVGYGLEGAIPDVYAKRIIEDYITPQFKRANYYYGIQEGIDSIIKLIQKEPLPEVKPLGFSADVNPDIMPLVFFLFIIIYTIHVQLRKMIGYVPSSSLFAGVLSGLGGAFLPIPIYGVGIIFAVAFFIFYFGGDNVTTRSSSGSRRGGGGGSSGGFSGGGGSSGGGGASGRW